MALATAAESCGTRSFTVCPIDPDHPDEKAFLQNLSQSLKLPKGLVSHLDAQVAQNLET